MSNAKDERGAFFIVTARVSYTNPRRRANDRSWTSPLSSACTHPILRSMSRSFESDPSNDSEAASAARARASARAISFRHFDPSTMKGKRFDPFLRSSSSATIAPGNADIAPVSPIQAPGVEPPIELVPPTPLDASDDEEKKRAALGAPANAMGSQTTSGAPPSPSKRGKGTGRDRSFSIVSLSQAVGDDECGICFEQLVIGVKDDETGEVRYFIDSLAVKRRY
jgi:hypothetical protein